MSTNREHVNTAEIVGRLGQEPELKHTEDGTPYVKLSIATSERFTDRGGGNRFGLWASSAAVRGRHQQPSSPSHPTPST